MMVGHRIWEMLVRHQKLTHTIITQWFLLVKTPGIPEFALDSTNPIVHTIYDRMLTFHKHDRHFQRKLSLIPASLSQLTWHPQECYNLFFMTFSYPWMHMGSSARVKIPKPSCGLWGSLIRKALNKSSKLGKPEFPRTRRRKEKKTHKNSEVWIIQVDRWQLRELRK